MIICRINFKYLIAHTYENYHFTSASLAQSLLKSSCMYQAKYDTKASINVFQILYISNIGCPVAMTAYALGFGPIHLRIESHSSHRASILFYNTYHQTSKRMNKAIDTLCGEGHGLVRFNGMIHPINQGQKAAMGEKFEINVDKNSLLYLHCILVQVQIFLPLLRKISDQN